MIVIADESKIVETLGAFPLPIEVNPFGLVSTRIAIEKAACPARSFRRTQPAPVG